MLKKVRIHIISENISPSDGTAERAEYAPEGHVRADAERFSLSYRETDASGMDGCRTVLSFLTSAPEVLYLSRTGSVNTHLTFEAGQTVTSAYEAPLVSFEVETETHRVRNRLREEGSLELDYTVRSAGADPSEIRFRLEFRE